MKGTYLARFNYRRRPGYRINFRLVLNLVNAHKVYSQTSAEVYIESNKTRLKSES